MVNLKLKEKTHLVFFLQVAHLDIHSGEIGIELVISLHTPPAGIE